MYKTHTLCDKNTKNFIGVGDPYIKAKVVNARFKGTQFQTNPAKMGQNAGTFTKFPEHKSDPYIDQYKCKPKNFKIAGFGSNDADRKGEFTLDVTAKQWKEKLKSETKFMGNPNEDVDDYIDPEVAKGTFRQTYPSPKWFQTQVPFHSIDIGRASGPNANGDEPGVTPICNKCSRDTFYCRHRIKASCDPSVPELRRGANGGLSPTSYNAYGAWNAEENKEPPMKPKAGRIRTTKQFFDSSHLIPGWGTN